MNRTVDLDDPPTAAVGFYTVGSKEARKRDYSSKAASRAASRNVSRPPSPRPMHHGENRAVRDTLAHPFKDEDIADMVRQIVVAMTEEKHLADKKSSHKTQMGRDDFIDMETRDEFIQSIAEYSSYGIPHGLNAEKMDDYTTRRLEMAYWRQKIQLQERELENNVKTIISVGSDVLESFLTAINVTGLHVKGLGKRTQSAIEEGKFHQCIRYYARTASPDGQSVFSNPYMSFMSTFAAIAFTNHLAGKNDEVIKAEQLKAQRKKKNSQTKNQAHRNSRDAKRTGARGAPMRVQTSYYTAHPAPAPRFVESRPARAVNGRPFAEHVHYEELLGRAMANAVNPDFDVQRATEVSSSSEDDTSANMFQQVVPTLSKLGKHVKTQKNITSSRAQLEETRTNAEDLI